MNDKNYYNYNITWTQPYVAWGTVNYSTVSEDANIEEQLYTKPLTEANQLINRIKSKL